jgi:hypothetical protein
VSQQQRKTDEDGDFEHFTASLALPHPDATGTEEQKKSCTAQKKSTTEEIN